MQIVCKKYQNINMDIWRSEVQAVPEVVFGTTLCWFNVPPIADGTTFKLLAVWLSCSVTDCVSGKYLAASEKWFFVVQISQSSRNIAGWMVPIFNSGTNGLLLKDSDD